MYNKYIVVLNKLRNNINKNSSIKNNTILAVILIISFIFTRNFKFYVLLNYIITVSIIIAFIYVNIIKTKFVDKTFMKSFDIEYLVLIMLIIINTAVIIFLFDDILEYYFLFLYSVQATIEYCAIGNIFKFRNGSLKSLLICVGYGVLFTIFFILFKMNFVLFNYYKSSFFMGIVGINIVISIGTCISTLENILRHKLHFSDYEFMKIIFYMFSIIINYFGLLCLSTGYKEIAEISIMIKCITFYKFYYYIISKMLDNSLKKINDNIEIATKTKKELNSILKKRNAILNEANLMIQKSQDKNNELIDSIYGGVFLFYLNKLQYVNKETVGVLNISNNEILGMDLNDFIKKYFNMTIEDIEKSQSYIPFAKMKHTNLEVEIFLTCIDEKSKIIYIHDIGEINENKKIRKVLEDYLEEDEIKNEFFANISHELKTPINLIFAALQVNQIYLKESNIEGINKNRKIIKQNCLRLIRTINNFIDANKISEGYVIPDYKIHNMVELVENISTASNKYIQLIDNTLTFDADKEELYVNCDKEMITRIILNILSNSVKYGKKGGSIKVSVGIYRDDYIIIKVENDGLEIDKETIPYIFDKFTKLNKTFNRLKEGSGLGLFLTKALIELQGGNIKLISNNRGNEFRIIMPRVNEPLNNEFIHEHWESNPLEEKIDIEFSDIYIE